MRHHKSFAVQRLLLIGLFACITAVAAENSVVQTLSFEWSAAQLQGRVLPHAAMLVPVDRRQASGPYLQFDTGAQHSLVYSWATPSLQRSGLLTRTDRAGTTSAQMHAGHDWTIELATHGANVHVDAAEMAHGAEGGPVGTLGADFVDGSLLVIDYARQRIHLVRGDAQSKVSQCLFKGAADLANIDLVGNRIGLPVKVAGKVLSPVLFDTGSSSFGLVLFDRSTWDGLGPSSQPPKTLVLSEGDTLQGGMSITTKTLDDVLCIGNACIRHPDIGVLGFQAVPGFVGTIGNREFGAGYVVFDYPQRRALVSRTPLSASRRECVRQAAKQIPSVKGG